MPPNASAIAWWPRHTPSTGIPSSGKRRAASIDTPASTGPARARGDHHAVGAAREQLVDRVHVVAHDVGLRAQLAQVLDEVVGEAVVVVDDEDLHSQSPCAHASSIASNIAPTFASVSRYSYAGSESATTPAPACMYATPSFTTTVRMWMQVSRSPV